MEQGGLPNAAGEDPQPAARRGRHEVQDHGVTLRLGEGGLQQLHWGHVQAEVAEGLY